MRYFSYEPANHFKLGSKAIDGRKVDAICIDQENRIETYFDANGNIIPEEDLHTLEIIQQRLADEYDPWFITE